MRSHIVVVLIFGIITLSTGGPFLRRPILDDEKQEFREDHRECLVCTKWCEYGFIPGPGGCPLCKCKPSPTFGKGGFGSNLALGRVCKELLCEYECLTGYAPDALGCPTCQCNMENEQQILEGMLDEEPNPL